MARMVHFSYQNGWHGFARLACISPFAQGRGKLALADG
jgi:hypothetical protein